MPPRAQREAEARGAASVNAADGATLRIQAHADVDEGLAAQGGALRYPRNGHVLYLKVGGRVQGPTCVWGAPDGGGATAAGDGELVVVPAVAAG